MKECIVCKQNLVLKQNKFCSYQCKNTFYFTKSKIEKSCPTCNNKFSVIASKSSQIYCSLKCKKDSIREQRICIKCNLSFSIKKTQVNKFCSNNCRVEYARLPEIKEDRIRKSQTVLKEKYGSNYLNSGIIHQKALEKKLEKYGDPNYVNIIKRMGTCFKKYGDKNYNNYRQIKITKYKRYGDANYNNRKKALKTEEQKIKNENLNPYQYKPEPPKNDWGVYGLGIY